jgi:protein TonB
MNQKIFRLLGNRATSFVGSTTHEQPTLVLSAPLAMRVSRQERSVRMLALLFILVLTLHLGGALWFAHPAPETQPPAKPLDMQISLVKVAPPKPAVPPPPTAPVRIKSAPQKKPQPKPKLKVPQIVQTPDEFAPTEQVFTQAPLLPAANPAEQNARTKTDPAPIVDPDYRASYAHNPAPTYPTAAQSRGWQGKVLLRVLVSAEGLSETVSIEQSSGYDILDESALEAVKKWQFTPAMQGETALASTVLVPIIFSLRDY